MPLTLKIQKLTLEIVLNMKRQKEKTIFLKSHRALINKLSGWIQVMISSKKLKSDDNLNEQLKQSYFRLKNKNSDLVMAVSEADTNDGKSIIQFYDREEYDEQEFLVCPNGTPGTYTFAAKHSGKVIGISEGGLDDGKRAIQWHFSPTIIDQRFYLESYENGSNLYQIKNLNSSKLLSVSGGSTEARANIIQYHERDHDEQRFYLVPSDPLPDEIRNQPEFPELDPNSYPPRLNSINVNDYMSGYQNYELIGRAWVSYLSVYDPEYDAQWQVRNSPYYRLDAKIIYKKDPSWFTYTEADGGDKFSRAITQGISESTTASVNSTVGFSFTESFGFPGVAEFSIGMSFQLGFDYSQTFTTTEETTITHEINVPQYNAGAFWEGQIKYELIRLGESSPFASWEVPAGPIISDTYSETDPN